VFQPLSGLAGLLFLSAVSDRFSKSGSGTFSQNQSYVNEKSCVSVLFVDLHLVLKWQRTGQQGMQMGLGSTWRGGDESLVDHYRAGFDG
jgi:hypothetical protein